MFWISIIVTANTYIYIHTQQALQQNAVAGPVLTRTIEQATLALELAKIYCAAPNPDIAVSAIAGSAIRPPDVSENLAL